MLAPKIKNKKSYELYAISTLIKKGLVKEMKGTTPWECGDPKKRMMYEGGPCITSGMKANWKKPFVIDDISHTHERIRVLGYFKGNRKDRWLVDVRWIKRII